MKRTASKKSKKIDGKKLAEDFEKAFVAAADERDEAWFARHTHSFEPKMGDKQMEETIQRLQSEKKDLNVRIKKLADRLEKLETEISSIRSAFDELVDWNI